MQNCKYQTLHLKFFNYATSEMWECLDYYFYLLDHPSIQDTVITVSLWLSYLHI